MVDLHNVQPFVRGRPENGPIPYLWAKCDIFDGVEPEVHVVEWSGECFEHRIVWPDNTGLTFEAEVDEFKPSELFRIYRRAREAAEEIEFYAAGAICH